MPQLCSRLLLALVALIGCSRLPGYAQPRGSLVEPGTLDESNQISYRGLTREDFQARRPPEGMNPYAERLGALTCTSITTTPDTGFIVTETQDSDGDATFEGRFKVLRFHARMDRNCSWWNASRPAVSDAYVLQHEQIHFAIVEAEARRLNARTPQIVSSFSVEESSSEEVQAAFQTELNRLVQRAMENLLERNRDFDEDTSGRFDPAAQQRWFDTLDRELRSLR